MVKGSKLKSKFLIFLNSSIKIRQIFQSLFLSKFVKFLMSVLNYSIYFSNFASFFIVTTHNSAVNFKLIHFLLGIKVSHKSPSFESQLSTALVKICQIPRYFPNQKSFFLQIFGHSLVSWKKTLLYFFRSKIAYFSRKEQIKVQTFETF